jgi:hypothetical protein
MDKIVLIAILVAVLIAFAVLFFFIDRYTKGKRAAPDGRRPMPEDKREEKAVEIKTPPPADGKRDRGVTEHTQPGTGDTRAVMQDLNENNLANDMEKLIDANKKVAPDPKSERYFKSRLANTGRMKEYYERHHGTRRGRYDNYGVAELNEDDTTPASAAPVNQLGTMALTPEEVQKLMNLQAILNRKAGEDL